jgi:uncharacterized membrane protein YukC
MNLLYYNNINIKQTTKKDEKKNGEGRVKEVYSYEDDVEDKWIKFGTSAFLIPDSDYV